MRRDAPRDTGFDAFEPFLEALATAPVSAAPSLGLGSDLRIEGERLAGCALEHEGVVHLTAFPRRDEPGRGRDDGREGAPDGGGFVRGRPFASARRARQRAG